MVMHIDDIIELRKEAGCWDRYIHNKVTNLLIGEYHSPAHMIMEDSYLQLAIDYLENNKSKECYQYYKHIQERMQKIAFE